MAIGNTTTTAGLYNVYGHRNESNLVMWRRKPSGWRSSEKPKAMAKARLAWPFNITENYRRLAVKRTVS